MLTHLISLQLHEVGVIIIFVILLSKLTQSKANGLIKVSQLRGQPLNNYAYFLFKRSQIEPMEGGPDARHHASKLMLRLCGHTSMTLCSRNRTKETQSKVLCSAAQHPVTLPRLPVCHALAAHLSPAAMKARVHLPTPEVHRATPKAHCKLSLYIQNARLWLKTTGHLKAGVR